MNQDFVEKATEFHGHLGPFLVLGLRMGVYAKDFIKPMNYKDIKAELFINPLNTPESCIIDGIQFSSGCTVGKRNLIIKEAESKGIECTFQGNNKSIKIKVKEMTIGVIKHNLSDHHHSHHHHGTPEDVSNDILEKDFDALFDYETR